MAQTKEQKKKIVEDLKEKIKNQKIMIFVDFTGLKVADIFELKGNLKLSEAVFKVAKKTLLCIALKDFSRKLAERISQTKRQIAVIFGFGKEPLVAKTVYQFSLKNPNLKILGGHFEGAFREPEEIITLAKLPTKEELLAKLVQSIAAPISNFVYVLESNLKGLIFILSKKDWFCFCGDLALKNLFKPPLPILKYNTVIHTNKPNTIHQQVVNNRKVYK